MSRRIEELMKDYPRMVLEQRCLSNQLAHFQGISAAEVIESMYTPLMDGERVQTSNISDKTAQIAMNYHERMEQMNREWYSYLEKQLRLLTEELSFFTAAIQSLPDELSAIVTDMVKEQMTWDAVAEKYHMSRANVGKVRKRAIAALDVLYDAHDRDTAEYLLS